MNGAASEISVPPKSATAVVNRSYPRKIAMTAEMPPKSNNRRGTNGSVGTSPTAPTIPSGEQKKCENGIDDGVEQRKEEHHERTAQVDDDFGADSRGDMNDLQCQRDRAAEKGRSCDCRREEDAADHRSTHGGVEGIAPQKRIE